MLRVIFYALCICICFVFQTTLFYGLSFGGIVPNLLIIITASVGFMRNEKEGLLVGFFCGILCDIFFGDMIGFQALIYMYIGFLNGLFSKIFYPEDLKLPLCLIAISDLSYGMVNYVFLFLLRGKFDFGFYMKSLIVPEVVYTLIITFALYPVLLFVMKRIEDFERKRARKFV